MESLFHYLTCLLLQLVDHRTPHDNSPAKASKEIERQGSFHVYKWLVRKTSKFQVFYESFSYTITFSPQADNSSLKIHFDTTLPSMPKSSKFLLPSGFPTKTPYASLFSPTRATCPVHIYCITRTISGAEKRPGGFAKCYCLNPRVTSSLLGQNTFINTPFSNISACNIHAVQDKKVKR